MINHWRSKRVVCRSMLEALEGRQLLSGNVAVTYDAGSNTVNIVGDNKSNDIVVTGLFVGVYNIKGQNGTTVNGGAEANIPAAGALGSNFKVSLGNGDDAAEFGNSVPGFSANAVSVETGNGEDTVGFHNVTAFGGLSISTGNGKDDVALDFVDIHVGLDIDTGNGNDSVAFGNTGTGVTLFDGDGTVDGGNGKDVLTGQANLHKVSAGQTITIDDFESVS